MATKTLMAMGGALDLDGPGAVISEFVQRAGGQDARIILLTTASARSDAGNEYKPAFEKLAVVREAMILPIRERSQTTQLQNIEMLREASGILMVGGFQLRLSSVLGGTPIETELRAAYERGVIIAGTSAGASYLSALMIAYGKDGSTPRNGIAQFTAGLGLTKKIVFDQHFRQRDRLGRLLYAVASNPGLLGVGVDENTAAILEVCDQNNDALKVCGRNAVTIVDGSQLQITNVAELENKQPVAMTNAIIHILTHGCAYHLANRRAEFPSDVKNKSDYGGAKH